jgi:DNA-directed RNA polymerase subunit RPC12/RpoP
MGYSKSNYEFLKSRGICTKCGKNKAVNKTTYCEYCLEKDVIKNAKYREKNRAVLRRKNKERMQKLRDKRKENRECTKCGKKLNPLYDGNYVKCKICRYYLQQTKGPSNDFWYHRILTKIHTYFLSVDNILLEKL